MPRLLAFAVCERVVLEEGTGNVSLISIFHNLNVGLAQETVPAGAALPIHWCVFTLWTRDEAVAYGKYEEICDIRDPNGTVKALSKNIFSMSADSHRNVTRMFGFPSIPGRYSITLSLRDESRGTQEELAVYPIELTFHPQTDGQ